MCRMCAPSLFAVAAHPSNNRTDQWGLGRRCASVCAQVCLVFSRNRLRGARACVCVSYCEMGWFVLSICGDAILFYVFFARSLLSAFNTIHVQVFVFCRKNSSRCVYSWKSFFSVFRPISLISVHRSHILFNMPTVYLV